MKIKWSNLRSQSGSLFLIRFFSKDCPREHQGHQSNKQRLVVQRSEIQISKWVTAPKSERRQYEPANERKRKKQEAHKARNGLLHVRLLVFWRYIADQLIKQYRPASEP